jgi:hypothetical protein
LGLLVAEPFLHRLLEALDFSAGGEVVGAGVLLHDAEFVEFVFEAVAAVAAAALGKAGSVDQAVVGQDGGGDAVGGNGLRNVATTADPVTRL